jgi:hypothetical protein
MSTQTENLNRVSNRIADAIMSFVEFKKATGERHFYVGDLHSFVQATGGFAAPSSPDRVLRSLRQAGYLDYKVVNRAQSLYYIL